jgi:D-serine deaminase-like pyridoxal phosphate-dependent protein
MKGISFDSGAPRVHGVWPDAEAPIVECGGDEHTILHFQSGVEMPVVGDQVLLAPGHCDPTVNLYDHLLAVRGDVVEELWPVIARGPGL